MEASLESRISEKQPLAEVSAWLDGLGARERIEAVTSLSAKAIRTLYAMIPGHPVDPSHFVPRDTPAGMEVVHHGVNSLHLFRRFEKVFVRNGTGDENGGVIGYNRTNGFVETVVGPGYFQLREDERATVIDYRKVPSRVPLTWPHIRNNADRLSRFVYHQTEDVMKRVSDHVSIGEVTKQGKSLQTHFILCREK